jgi:hypothetical protein
MPGMSLHIGLNSVDPAHYNGWDGALTACEFDASDMEALAASCGFTQRKTLLSAAATAGAVIAEIEAAAGALDAGDLFLLTYAGHGGQVTDVNGDETDRSDETWLAYDRQIVDDELYALFAKFKPGVRIVVLSDSCHSGSVTRAIPGQDGFVPNALRTRESAAAQSPRFRAMPLDVMAHTYRDHKQLYDDIQASVPSETASDPAATVLLISGCQDNQLSSDGMSNGLFTETLRAVWQDGAWDRPGGYASLCADVVAQMPPDQTPLYSRVGAANDAFEQERPFTI